MAEIVAASPARRAQSCRRPLAPPESRRVLAPPESRRRGRPWAGPVRHAAIVPDKDSGGPAPEASGNGGPGVGRAGQVTAARAMTARTNVVVRSRCSTSFSNRAGFPLFSWMTEASPRHSTWLGVMPRPRQMSASTAPAGRRRISASISACVISVSACVTRWARPPSPPLVRGFAGRAARGWRRGKALARRAPRRLGRHAR